jgi:hypothetical protein
VLAVYGQQRPKPPAQSGALARLQLIDRCSHLFLDHGGPELRCVSFNKEASDHNRLTLSDLPRHFASGVSAGWSRFGAGRSPPCRMVAEQPFGQLPRVVFRIDLADQLLR